MKHAFLRASGLSKKFGPVEAVKNAAFSLSKNRITAFLGENGAGKTTTLKLILGFLRPDSGGAESWALRIGYVPERPAYFGWLKGKEVIAATAQAHGIEGWDLPATLETVSERISFDLKLLERKVQTYSLGNQKKFSYLQSLLISPDLLIVDEPFTALDPPSIKNTRELFWDLKSEGTTIFLSSHLVSEVEKICDEFIIISRGQVIVQEDLRRIENDFIFLRFKASLSDINKLSVFSPWYREKDSYVVILIEKTRLEALQDSLRPEFIGAPEWPDLEKIFLFFVL